MMHEACIVCVPILDLFCMHSHMRVNLKPGKTEMIKFAVSDSVRAALKAANTLSFQDSRYISCRSTSNWGVMTGMSGPF